MKSAYLLHSHVLMHSKRKNGAARNQGYCLRQLVRIRFTGPHWPLFTRTCNDVRKLWQLVPGFPFSPFEKKERRAAALQGVSPCRKDAIRAPFLFPLIYSSLIRIESYIYSILIRLISDLIYRAKMSFSNGLRIFFATFMLHRCYKLVTSLLQICCIYATSLLQK